MHAEYVWDLENVQLPQRLLHLTRADIFLNNWGLAGFLH